MENFLSSIPTTPVGWFATFCFVLASAVFLMSKIRKDDLLTLRQSNQDLRVALADMRIEMDEMKIKITDLESKNGTLHDIVSTALNDYFTNNPKLAQEYKQALEMTYKQLVKLSSKK